MNLFLGIMLPFVGTVLGAACVFLIRKEVNSLLQKGLMGFASGAMLAASVWSLLIPALDMSENMGKMAFAPAAVGLLLGMAFLLFFGKVLCFMERNEKVTTLVLAMTLHNIPEGMAVGVVFAGMLSENSQISFIGAMVLTVGIAIQNFPDGAVVSLPLRSAGCSRSRAFGAGVLSGVVEPLAAGITVLMAEIIEPILPYVLSFAAGAMLYVVVGNLIPDALSGERMDIGMLGFVVGFVLMMALDVALG